MKQFDRLTLNDVQGLFGGQDLTLNSDGSGNCQVVKLSAEPPYGMEEVCRAVQLNADELHQLHELVEEVDLMHLFVPERLGVPDEAYPTITIQLNRQSHSVSKWASDRHAGFDAVYAKLCQIVRKAVEETD